MPGAPRHAILSLAALLACPALLAAQGAALSGVRGAVTSIDGSAVEHAQIEIRHDASGRIASVRTDDAGRYVMTNLLAGGPHTITASALGYATHRIDGVHLQAGTIHPYDFVLRPGAMALPEVEVRARADPRFDAARSGAATVVSREDMAAHPTVERDVLELAALSPMAARAPGGTTIAGQNTRFNALQIDGARYQDMFGASADGAPGGLAHARPLPLDAVDQFQVLVAPFDVRHSGFTGGLLNVVTRSGTNRWEAGGFGYYRDRNFLGRLDATAQSAAAPAFRNALAGFSLGGPIVRDRAHFFVAFEAESRRTVSSGFNLGTADPFATRIAPDSAARFAAILRDRYAVDAGSTAQLSLDNPRENLYLRTDWQLGRHRLLLRHNHAFARRDVEPARAPVGTYELGSQVFRYTSASRATSLQVVSAFGARWSNELLVHVHHIGDRTSAASAAPAIEVDVVSRFDTLRVKRRMRAGGHVDAQRNNITQSGIELRNAMTGALDSHLFTLGGSAELLRFDSRYTHNPNGLYYFRSLADLEANRPARFERTLTLPGRSADARFDVGHISVFAQDEWRPFDGLTLHAGVRMDLPLLRDRPNENPELLDALGVSTALLPRTTPMWSPRFAFNWQSRRELRTQVRGGAGLFAGRPAYAWLADAYAQTGLDTVLLFCDLAATPALDAQNLADACADAAPNPDGSMPQGRAATRSAPVVLFDTEFRFPQDLRIAAGVDQSLPFGLVASADIVLGMARRQVFLRDINIGEAITDKPHELGYTDGFGFHRRNSYGTPSIHGFAPVRRADGFHQVIQLGDDAENRALAASVELAGAGLGFAFRGAYTFTRSIDVQSLSHRNAAANFGSVPVAGDPNAPVAARSDFDRPHRVLLSLSHRLRRAGGTELSLLYVGESGTPYTYVYGLDINGDAAPGPGLDDSFNDPLYVPATLSAFPGALGSAIAFEDLLQIEPCLAAWRGLIMPRNECRSPALHRLDLRASHALDVRGTEVRLVADLLNALHLLGSDRGRVVTVPALVPILDVESPRTGNLLGPPPPERVALNASYAGARVRSGTDRLHVLPPGTLDPAASRWQAQIGIEIRR
ncbi:MAG TPA: carboxypeptidase regulatory-like domain-containing protein [Longimicrobiales bacterium]|nr:carboxypeptidase regulatory-like domain-containing protein [Longimicrobiales bacterium]